MNATQYLKRAILASSLVIALVVAFNWIVDPYGITDARRIPGFNEYKTDINQHTRMLKKYQPQFGRYDTLIVGNSRAEMALDPGHSCFRTAGMSVYNLGIPGATLQTQLSYALNVIYQQDIKHLFIGLDFTDFIYPQRRRGSPGIPLFEQKTGELQYLPSGDSNPDFIQAQFTDYLKALFSIDAVVSSVQTILGQGRYSSDRTHAGFNPGRDFEGVVAVEGPDALFTQKMEELVPKYTRPWYLRDDWETLREEFSELDEFLDIAVDKEIRVHLFTNPLHEKYWELMEQNGHLALKEDWMNVVTERVQAGRGQPISFWDFAADSPYIHEQVPEPGVLSDPLEWFWEPSHYRHELGGLMLQTMLAQACGSEPVFGRRVL